MSHTPLNDLFKQRASQQGWDEATQVVVLLTYLDMLSSLNPPPAGIHADFDDFLQSLIRAEADVANPNPPPAAPMPLADIENFFDRSLAKASLQRLTVVRNSVTHSDGHEQITLDVPQELHSELSLSLDGVPGEARYGADEITGGVYSTLDDGSVAAIAVVAASPRWYVDAFCILPESADPAAPNPSLPPRYSIAEPFEFVYPDGSRRVIVLRPSS